MALNLARTKCGMARVTQRHRWTSAARFAEIRTRAERGGLLEASAKCARDEPKDAERQHGRGPDLYDRLAHVHTIARHEPQRWPYDGDDAELAELYPRVEPEKCVHDTIGRQTRFPKDCGESEAVYQAEDECNSPTQRGGARHALH